MNEAIITTTPRTTSRGHHHPDMSKCVHPPPKWRQQPPLPPIAPNNDERGSRHVCILSLWYVFFPPIFYSTNIYIDYTLPPLPPPPCKEAQDADASWAFGMFFLLLFLFLNKCTNIYPIRLDCVYGYHNQHQHLHHDVAPNDDKRGWYVFSFFLFLKLY